MELNAEQIKKALECCRGKGCKECPYRCGDATCISTVASDALSLINELTEKNKRLKAQNYMMYPDGRLEMIPTVESVRADTVRKMQDKFTLHFGTYTAKDTVKVLDVFKLLDQIAKEMLEEE